MDLELAAPCLFGLESLVSKELKALGAEKVAAENGRVRFAGDEYVLARANLGVRYAERIFIVLGSFTAHTFEELFQGVRALPLENWIGRYDAFPVAGHTLNSDLFSVRDCQSIIKKAAVERLKEKYGISWFEETGARAAASLFHPQKPASTCIWTPRANRCTSAATARRRTKRPSAKRLRRRCARSLSFARITRCMTRCAARGRS